MNSRVIHFEIPSDDTEAGRKFFSEAFGWTFKQFNESDDYWMATTGEDKSYGINGAIMKRKDPRQPLAISIHVDDVDAALKKIEQAGGSVAMPKMAVPTVGWVAYFNDPDGNLHGIVQLDMAAMQGASELVIERFIDASPKRVWQMWTEPDLVKHWWGPKGFTSPVSRIDLRVGGKYLNCMRSPEGKDYWSTGTYREIVPFKHVVASDSFADEQGNVVSASEYGMEGMPLEMTIDTTFEERSGQTKITLRHQGMPAGMMEDAKQGWHQSLDKLAENLR
jgi:predicted enzyme related to lactoylglutathione lyase/uncharacterized protein YndB with AHSA1/START domain